MAVNPMELMKMKKRLEIFAQQHPRFPAFLKEIGDRGVQEGTIVELKVTEPDGKSYITNIKLTPDDIESINIARNIKH